MTPAEISDALEQILPQVTRPARYVGGEVNQIVKAWEDIPIRVALAFPDIYDLGVPNTGLAILYDIINQQTDMLAERAYCPWTDMETLLRREKVPLFSLETKHALSDFDLIGISLPYESVFTNVLTLLELGGIPLRSADRAGDDPVVIGGGHATFNPEPMWPFFDGFVIGEGEEIILEIAHTVHAWRATRAPRHVLHQRLAQVPGVYVPSLYQVTYRGTGLLAEPATPLVPQAPARVQKRIVARLPPPLTRFIVPNIETVHNRVTIEIMRGCTRGCRFCHAGMVTRPVRERKVEEVVDALAVALEQTGFNEVGLLSLSSSDYGPVLELVNAVRKRFADRHLDISLPSLRIESFSVDLMDALQGASRRGGFTLAPEAASERMREIINKPVSSAQVIDTAREVYARGWHTIKLYFMIGHPEETADDVREITRLCQAVLAEGRKALGGRARVNVGVSTFVPKPHTPFQWVPCDRPESIEAKQAILRAELRGQGFKLSWSQVEDTLLEAWLTRGDRRLSEVVYGAWKRGARFDAWQEHFRADLWREAFVEADLDPDFYTHRQREENEIFPWEHIDAALKKEFLWDDYQWSLAGRTRVDCRDKCFACGILPKFKEIRRENPGDGWKCPDVGKAALKAQIVKAGQPPQGGDPTTARDRALPG